MQRLIIRADGNKLIGLGHIYRALALVEMLKNDFDCHFATSGKDPDINKLILSYCKNVIPLQDANVYETTEFGKMRNELSFDMEEIINSRDLVITDGYFFGPQYQRSLKQKGCKLGCITDFSDDRFYADIVINHGDLGAGTNYHVEHGAKVLTGFRYLIVRKEFLEAAAKQRRIKKIDTALVCMGGADPFNITIKVINACLDLDFIKTIIVVTGSAYGNKPTLENLIGESSNKKRIIHKENLTAKEMIKAIEMSEMAICPASTIGVESVCAKIGLLTGTVAGNQFAIHKQLIETKSAVSVKDFNMASVEDIKNSLIALQSVYTVNSMMENQARAVDGLSGQRILKEFKALAS